MGLEGVSDASVDSLFPERSAVVERTALMPAQVSDQRRSVSHLIASAAEELVNLPGTEISGILITVTKQSGDASIEVVATASVQTPD